MRTTAKRSTIYLDPLVHKALRNRSVETSQSMSRLVNEVAARALAEDAQDLAAFKERAREPLTPLTTLSGN